jgi:hypothetical protein
MPDEEDELLADEIARAGLAGARLAGAVYFPRLMTAPARWLTRRSRKGAGEQWLRLPGDPLRVRDQAMRAMRDHGRLVDTGTDENGSYRVRGMVHYGPHGWGRVLVAVTVTPSSSGHHDVCVRGASKEGLIKMGRWQEGVRLVAEALPQAIPEYGARQWPS